MAVKWTLKTSSTEVIATDIPARQHHDLEENNAEVAPEHDHTASWQ